MGKKEEKNERNRLIVALLLTLFFMGFILLNVAYRIGFIYLVLSMVCLIVVIFWNQIPKKRPDRTMFSFQKDWLWDFIIGIGIGIAILFLLKVLPGFSIVAPSVPAAGAFPEPLASAGQYITVVGAAPLVEEIAFRTVLLAVLFIVVGLSFFWSAFWSSLAFSLYHIQAYAGEIAFNPIIAVSGAFITAFVLAMVFCYINKWRGSVTTGMGAHASINGGIIGGQLIAIG